MSGSGSQQRVITIVGAGAAGVLTACRVMREADPDTAVRLVDAAASTGRGIAYGTTDSRHLLNVPVARMSADPEDPDGFLHWLSARGRSVGASDYVPRMWFGEYLESELSRAAAASRARLYRITEDVYAVRRSGQRYRVRLRDGMSFLSDVVILAIGEPHANAAQIRHSIPSGLKVSMSPWDPADLHAAAAGADAVLLRGSGLTAIDMAVALDRPGRRIFSVSRSGLLPQPHAATPPSGIVLPPLIAEGELSYDEFRALVQQQMAIAQRELGDWRAGIDGIRPVMDEFWQRLSLADQRRFAHTDRRWFEVLRHRAPVQVLQRIQVMQRQGRLAFASGGISRIRRTRGGWRVTAGDGRSAVVAAMIDCSGPGIPSRSNDYGNTLIGRLVRDGLARLNPQGLGLAVTETGVVLDRSGDPLPGLLAIGGYRRGDVWETTAIPQLRVQAQQVGRLAVRPAARVAAHRATIGQS